MEKKLNNYESPLIETVETKIEGVICASCNPVNEVNTCPTNACGSDSDCPDFGFGGGGGGSAR